jgi:RNA polymerase subunit RPABC4/transcription elongation factor Spt4
MHEIGHIFMNHLIEFDETILMRSTLTEKKYKILENEANSFARNVLAPVMVVKELKIDSVDDLVKYFEMSHGAAKVRLNTVMQDYKKLLSQFIRFQRDYFKSFIHTCLYSKKCVKCSHYFVEPDAKYCPICSSKRLYKSKKETNIVKYDGYDVDEFGRAIECPRCGNVDVLFDGEYCIACSIIIINKCTNHHIWNGEVEWECGTILPGNARYCYKCGSKSTFFEQDLLDEWDKEQRAKELTPF